MHRLAAISLLSFSAALVALPASAQAPAPPEPSAEPAVAPAAGAPAPAPAAPAPSPAATPSAATPPTAALVSPPAPARAVCVMGAHPGVDPGSAATAVGLVCDELRKLGVPVAGAYERPDGAASAYRVELQRLDALVLLRVTYEAPIGTPRDSRTAVIGGLDEVLVAGKRVATALVTGRPLEDTAEVDSLLAGESRKYRKKSGEMFYGLGLSGFAVPAVSMHVGSAFGFDAFYETPKFAVGSGLRFAISESKADEKRASVGALSIGGRGFLTDGDFAPYVGGGLAYTWMSLTDTSAGRYDSGDGDGFGAYAEVGLEMLRFYKTRLLVGVRVDVPFYSVETNGMAPVVAPPGSTSGPTYTPHSDSTYAVPVTLGATFAF